MSFLDIKAQTRRTVHATFAVPCVLTTGDGSFDVTARLHGKVMVGGDIESQGYSVTLEGVFHVVFNREELSVLGLRPIRSDRVTFHDYIGPGQDVAVELDARDEYDGPIDEKWSVAQFISAAPPSVASAAGIGEADGEL